MQKSQTLELRAPQNQIAFHRIDHDVRPTASVSTLPAFARAILPSPIESAKLENRPRGTGGADGTK